LHSQAPHRLRGLIGAMKMQPRHLPSGVERRQVERDAGASAIAGRDQERVVARIPARIAACDGCDFCDLSRECCGIVGLTGRRVAATTCDLTFRES
jgi:hypothetical protein